MDNLFNRPLSEIVNERHETAAVFEKYNLDYSCEGERSLQEACRDSHVAPQHVVEEIQAIYAQRKNELDFGRIKLYQLADYIVYMHHSYVKREVPRLLTGLENLSAKYGNTWPGIQALSVLLGELFAELAYHLHRQEKIIFPRIKQLEQNGFEPLFSEEGDLEYLLNPIIVMEEKDRNVINMMKEIRRLTHDYTPPGGASDTFRPLYETLHAFEVDLHHHVHLENNILFPKAIALAREAKSFDPLLF